MTADDVRWLAQKLVDGAFDSVSTESVKAMAERLVALEANHAAAAAEATRRAQAEAELADAQEEVAKLKAGVAEEREACAQLVGDVCVLGSGNEVRTGYATAIRARGAK